MKLYSMGKHSSNLYSVECIKLLSMQEWSLFRRGMNEALVRVFQFVRAHLLEMIPRYQLLDVTSSQYPVPCRWWLWWWWSYVFTSSTWTRSDSMCVNSFSIPPGGSGSLCVNSFSYPSGCGADSLGEPQSDSPRILPHSPPFPISQSH